MHIMDCDVLNHFHNISQINNHRHREENVVEREYHTKREKKHKNKLNAHTDLTSSDEITYIPKKKKKKHHRHKEENGQNFDNKCNKHVMKTEPKTYEVIEQELNKLIESVNVGKQHKNNMKSVETSASEIDTPVKKKKKLHKNKEENIGTNLFKENKYQSTDSNINRVRNDSFNSDSSTPVKKKKKLHKNKEANFENVRNDSFNSDSSTPVKKKKRSHNDKETNLKSNADLFKEKKSFKEFHSTDSNINKVRNDSFNSDSSTPVKKKKKSHKKDEYIDSPKETKLFHNSNGLDLNMKEVNTNTTSSLDESCDPGVTTPVKQKRKLHKNIYTTTPKDSSSDTNTTTKKKKKHQEYRASKIILKYEYTSSDTDDGCNSEKGKKKLSTGNGEEQGKGIIGKQYSEKNKEQYCNGGDSFEGDLIQNHSHESDTSTQCASMHKQNNSKIDKHQKEPLLENNSTLENTVKQESLNGDSSLDYDAITDLLQLSDHSRLSEQQQDMLKQLTVMLPWPVHESHLIETRMSTHPSKEQQKRFKELGFNMKIDHYTADEDARIRKNWNKFCKLHDIPSDPQPFMAFEVFRNSKIKGSVLPKKERINFVRFLGHHLPHRCLFSIYRRFKKLYSVDKKGKFSMLEDSIILNYVQNCPDTNKFAQLAIVLKRDRHAILLRYKLLCKKRRPLTEAEDTL